jgi:hypothetical protein
VEAQFSRTDGIREKYAWLPDGHLLYVDSTGEVTRIEPCQPGAEQLTDHLPDRFTQIAAYESKTGRVLLQSENAFWILDGRSMEVQSVPDVTPNPYDLHWDRATWLPGGEGLVIARLNGRSGSKAGATLFLIDGETGEIQNSLDLEGDFGQGAPWVEALSQKEVLLHSQGKLLIADFSVTPIILTDVLESIFGLDIQYPDEVSAAGSHIREEGEGYSLSVRLNHPRNQATYLYDSATGSVHVYAHEHHTLLLFPDGYLMEMPKQESVPTYTDEYDPVNVDDPEAIQPRLVLTGHTPREYPHLSIEYLVERSQLAVASAHGVSLVSLPDGEMQAYWSLPGVGYSPWLSAAPDGSALVAAKDSGGLYYIPLP